MKPSPHKTLTAVQAVAAGLLLGPFALASTYNERWPIVVLAVASMVTIFLSQRPTNQSFKTHCWISVLAGAVLSAGALLALDKLLLLSGAMFLSLTLWFATNVSRLAALFATICACLMVPLPAPVETALATELASMEASLFVIIGQAAGLPVRLSGAQVFFEQSVVTINQDCSGTLLLVPALLGALVAASLTGSKKAAFAAISLAVPIALSINLVRLGVVMALIASGSLADADTWHDMLGFFALTVSWALPIMIFADLSRFKIDWSTLRKLAPTATVAFMIGISINVVSPSTSMKVSNQLSLPPYIAGWVAEPMPIPAQELKILNADQVARQRYTAKGGEFVVTAMHHFDPSIGREHSSERCFKAMGWQVTKLSSRRIDDLGMLTSLITRSGGHSQSVLELEITGHPSTNGLVRIQLVASTAMTIAEQRAFLEAFTANTLGDTL